MNSPVGETSDQCSLQTGDGELASMNSPVGETSDFNPFSTHPDVVVPQ